MQAIRYGIIGCGSMGREHMENLRAMGGAVVTAIADPHAASREQAAALCSTARRSSSSTTANCCRAACAMH